MWKNTADQEVSRRIILTALHRFKKQIFASYNSVFKKNHADIFHYFLGDTFDYNLIPVFFSFISHLWAEWYFVCIQLCFSDNIKSKVMEFLGNCLRKI